MAIALAMKRGTYSEHNATVEFPVIDTAATIGWDSGLVKNQLKKLEWTTTGTFINSNTLLQFFEVVCAMCYQCFSGREEQTF